MHPIPNEYSALVSQLDEPFHCVSTFLPVSMETSFCNGCSHAFVTREPISYCMCSRTSYRNYKTTLTLASTIEPSGAAAISCTTPNQSPLVSDSSYVHGRGSLCFEIENKEAPNVSAMPAHTCKESTCPESERRSSCRYRRRYSLVMLSSAADAELSSRAQLS